VIRTRITNVQDHKLLIRLRSTNLENVVKTRRYRAYTDGDGQ